MVLSLFGKFIKSFFWGRLALLPIGTGAAESLLFARIQGEEGTSPVPVRGWGLH